MISRQAFFEGIIQEERNEFGDAIFTLVDPEDEETLEFGCVGQEPNNQAYLRKDGFGAVPSASGIPAVVYRSVDGAHVDDRRNDTTSALTHRRSSTRSAYPVPLKIARGHIT